MATFTHGPLTVIDVPPVHLLQYRDGWTTADLVCAVEGVLERGGPRFATLQDVRGTAPAGVLERKNLLSSLQGFSSELDRRQVAVGVITDSAVMRGAIHAVLWFFTPPYAITSQATLEAGIDAISPLVEEAGVPLTSAVRSKLLSYERERAAAAKGG